MENFRHFRAGPDPFGRVWQVDLLWLQTATSIRHSDSVDVKFLLSGDDSQVEKMVSLQCPDLLELSRKSGRAVTDPWCMNLAAHHLASMVESGEDFEKPLVTVKPEELENYGAALET